MIADSITIRQMVSQDIQAGMRLKTIAGWNQTEHDWQLCLDLNPAGCFVAVYKGEVVGTVTAVCYSNRLAWIGMMLVDPDFRRSGIASRLMQHVMTTLKGCETIKLDATPVGKKVYDRSGFEDEYILYRMGLVRQPSFTIPKNTPKSSILPLNLEDWPAITKLDSEVFGADREAVISSFAQTSQKTALKYITNGNKEGRNNDRGHRLN